MLYMENHIGKITISDQYLRSLTEQTVLQCFGVAGLARTSVLEQLLGGASPAVSITTKNEKLEISIHILVAYGVNIPTVVRSLMHKIEFVIEDAVRVPVSHVRVYVDGIVAP